MPKIWKISIPVALIIATLLVWQVGFGPKKPTPGTAAGELGANSAFGTFTKTFEEGYEASGKIGCDVLTEASADRLGRTADASCAKALEQMQQSTPNTDRSWLLEQSCRYREMTSDRAVCDLDVATPVPASLKSLFPRPQVTLVRSDGRWRIDLPTS